MDRHEVGRMRSGVAISTLLGGRLGPFERESRALRGGHVRVGETIPEYKKTGAYLCTGKHLFRLK